MRYQGGKSRIAKPIAQIIMQVAGGDCFVSLFCGSCAVESKVQGFSRKLLNDRHEYLIAMLQGVQQGYNLPEHITLEQYRYIRENKDADPVLAGFVGFGCSFGGKWFGGYARNKTGTIWCPFDTEESNFVKLLSQYAACGVSVIHSHIATGGGLFPMCPACL